MNFFQQVTAMTNHRSNKTEKRLHRLGSACSLGLLLALCVPSLRAEEAPRIETRNGHHALLVDGKPFLVLGAQINNSSSWASSLPQVWPALAAMHANTVEAPVYWEQMEPQSGHFDFSTVDALVNGAREHQLRLVVLWFGTWKNGNMHYAPQWVKTDTKKYPRVINAAGEPIDVLSANSRTNLEADKAAFTALMHHLAGIDSTQHTVIFVQVENESGNIGSARDFSAASQKEFEGQVPADFLKASGKERGTWRDVFRGRADEMFQLYHQARYINEIAAAGKREFAVPLYCNVWVSYPIAELPERQIPNPGIAYPSGGPVQDVVGLWKALAPSVDVIGPDIYSGDPAFYRLVLKAYARPDNALWIPETGNGDNFAPFLFLALGQGAIGFSPFGIDRTGWTFSNDKGPVGHTENYALLAPMAREIAAWNFEGKLQTAVELSGGPEQELDFGEWKASVSFGPRHGDGTHALGTSDHTGRVFIAQIASDEFLVAGFETSVAFHVQDRLPGIRMQILSAEEGRYENGEWHPLRLWNGDQTDRGLNFRHDATTAVRIKLGRF